MAKAKIIVESANKIWSRSMNPEPHAVMIFGGKLTKKLLGLEMQEDNMEEE